MKSRRLLCKQTRRRTNSMKSLVQWNPSRKFLCDKIVFVSIYLLCLNVVGLIGGVGTAVASDNEKVWYHGSLRRSELVRTFPSDPRRTQDAGCTAECCAQVAPCSCSSSEGDSTGFNKVPPAVQIVLMIVLLCLSAMFAGLTLGMMGLDKTGLEIVMGGDDPKYAAYARHIYSVRKRGNLLLCTIVLGNVLVNSLLSIITADKFGGLIGVISSTLFITIFGEITPQALCKRYALDLGNFFVPAVKFCMVLLLPVTLPLALALDYALGEELATTYSNAELVKLLQIHVQEDAMDPDTAKTMKGALQYKDKVVREVMTPLENTFMLSADEQLNFETLAKIFKAGYSRIPVYSVSKNNVIGMLFVKDLIFVDPEDNTRVSDFVNIFGRGVHVVWPDDTLGDVLRDLRNGKSHLALVRDVNNSDETLDPFFEVLGIITMEDIIEEIIGGEIIDETDQFCDGTHSVPVNRTEGFKWAALGLLDSKLVDERLSFDETKAVVAHLSKNFPSFFSLISDGQLHRLVAETPVSVLPTAEIKIGQEVPDDLLYRRRVETDVCVLILSGKVTALVGDDNFRSDLSSWSLLGGGSLINSPYLPDFTAWVSSGPCRCLRISRVRFASALDASRLERDALSHDGGGKPGDPSSNATLPPNSAAPEPFITPAGEGVIMPPVQPTNSQDSTPKTRKFKFFEALRGA